MTDNSSSGPPSSSGAAKGFSSAHTVEELGCGSKNQLDTAAEDYRAQFDQATDPEPPADRTENESADTSGIPGLDYPDSMDRASEEARAEFVSASDPAAQPEVDKEETVEGLRDQIKLLEEQRLQPNAAIEYRMDGPIADEADNQAISELEEQILAAKERLAALEEEQRIDFVENTPEEEQPEDPDERPED